MSGSWSSWSRKSEVFGSCPIATKKPSVASSLVSPVTVSRSRTPVTLVSPSTSSTTLFSTSSILSFWRTRSTMIGEARNSSRRCTRYTLLAKREMKLASSMAESPPPTTVTTLSRKNEASQVAQYETPRPCSRTSDSSPSWRAVAPVATITVSARYSSSPT